MRNIKYKLQRLYDTVRYDIPDFILNIWFFRKELYRFRTWDSSYNISLFRRSLEATLKSIEFGLEEENSRMKKVKAINRAIELMKHFEEDKYLELAEEKLNYKFDIDFVKDGNNGGYKFTTNGDSKKDKEVMYLSYKIEIDEWIELWEIIKGIEYSKDIDDWDKEYDGSNLKRWWD